MAVNMNYAIQQLKFNILWNQGYLGDGITIGVVDSGVEVDHIMLQDKIIAGKNFSNDGRPVDDLSSQHYHGTSVSALICGDYINYKVYGVAPNAKLVFAKALNDEGKATTEVITNAINYCIDQKVDIINCSVGCSENDYYMEQAVRRAVANNISVVVSAGNEGHADFSGTIREMSYPAGYDDSICVGAMDIDYNVADFSNSNEYVDIIAPGVNVLTAYPGGKYAYCDGTSFSAPIISGILALLKQKFKVEFKRNPSEAELYAMLIKYTRKIQGIPLQCQGHGYPDFSINKIRRA